MMRRGPKETVELAGAIKRGLERDMSVRALADVLDVSTQTVYYHRSKLLKGDAGGGKNRTAPAAKARKVGGRG